MGNSNLGPTSINNLDFKRENSIVFSKEEEQNYKHSIKAEKKKMNKILTHNNEEKDAELIEKCLSNHFLLRSLEKPAAYEIIRQLSYYHINSDVEIFKEGQCPGYFFILANGICELISEGAEKKISRGRNLFW